MRSYLPFVDIYFPCMRSNLLFPKKDECKSTGKIDKENTLLIPSTDTLHPFYKLIITNYNVMQCIFFTLLLSVEFPAFLLLVMQWWSKGKKKSCYTTKHNPCS